MQSDCLMETETARSQWGSYRPLSLGTADTSLTTGNCLALSLLESRIWWSCLGPLLVRALGFSRSRASANLLSLWRSWLVYYYLYRFNSEFRRYREGVPSLVLSGSPQYCSGKNAFPGALWLARVHSVIPATDVRALCLLTFCHICDSQ